MKSIDNQTLKKNFWFSWKFEKREILLHQGRIRWFATKNVQAVWMIVNWLMTLANWTQQLRQIVALPSPAVIIFLPQRHHNMTQITLHFRPLHLRSILLTVIHSTPSPPPSPLTTHFKTVPRKSFRNSENNFPFTYIFLSASFFLLFFLFMTKISTIFQLKKKMVLNFHIFVESDAFTEKPSCCHATIRITPHQTFDTHTINLP